MSTFSNFWAELMSGPNNMTPAIGRYLALALFLIFLVLIPAVLVGGVLIHLIEVPTISALLPILGAYVGMIVGACTVLIRALNPTEPRQGDQP